MYAADFNGYSVTHIYERCQSIITSLIAALELSLNYRVNIDT